MPASGSPPVRRRRLGAELRRLREGSGQTAEAVGKILGWSKAKVSRYELAQSGLKPSDVRSLLDLYGIHGERRQRLLTLAEEATQRGWWEDFTDVLTPELAAFIGLEAEATSELQWQVSVIPGLLQTERYAWHVMSGFQGVRPARSEVIDRRVQARLKRHQVLAREQPLELTAILDESVLRRQRGDRSVMNEQLQHLVQISEKPNVTIRIIRLDGPKGLALDSFTILQFGKAHDTPLHDVVSAESVQSYLYVEGEADTFEFRLAFDGLANDALGAEESRDFISDIARQLWSLVHPN
jgi:transcriptional regulator with XRE-family HTH domain